MDLDTFQNIGLVALGLACIYMFKQRDKVDDLEKRTERLEKHCKIDPDEIDIDWHER
jgi:hypothetical protein